MDFPEKAHKKLEERKHNNLLRSLDATTINGIDFSSNDYLGFAKNKFIFTKAHSLIEKKGKAINGVTGSRLLSGNHPLYTPVENQLNQFHNSESSLVFTSGYTANVGFFSCVPQKNDILLYDEFIHASIRDGIRLSNAKTLKFKHNSLIDLERLLQKNKAENTTIFVVTESVFSMDGDSPDLKNVVDLCKKNQAFCIIDEAHAVGVFGDSGVGLIQELNLEKEIFARIITFGKALGCHGAAILGSKKLTEYLINFSRSFIYTTGLSPHSLATIYEAYSELKISQSSKQLQENIQFFTQQLQSLELPFIPSNSSIQCCLIPGNTKVKQVAEKLLNANFIVKPIRSPTVPIEQERLRFCIHSYNTKEEMSACLTLLKTIIND